MIIGQSIFVIYHTNLSLNCLLIDKHDTSQTHLLLQSACFSNRNIHCNKLVAHEILSTFSKKLSRKGYMAIELDIKKAYDRLDWDFIRKCSTGLNFCVR